MPDPQDRPLSTPGRRPYGDTAAERAVLRSIRAMRGKRQTWQQIADELNARGRLQRNGRPWTRSGVASVARHVIE